MTNIFSGQSLMYLIFIFIGILGFVISKFIIKLLLGIVSNFELTGPGEAFLKFFEIEMYTPCKILLQLGFLFWIASSFESFCYINDIGLSVVGPIMSVVIGFLDIALIIFVLFAIYRIQNWIIRCVTHMFEVKYFDYKFFLHGIVESIQVATIVVMLVVFFLMAMTFPATKYLSNVIFSIVTTLNVFSVTIALGLAPLFRDIIAGLYVYSNRTFEPGDFLEIVGYGRGGYVREFRLRLIVLQSLDDSFIYIPNVSFVYFPVINHDAAIRYYGSETLVLRLFAPLQLSSNASKLKLLVVDVEKKLRSLNSRSTAFVNIASLSLFHKMSKYLVYLHSNYVLEIEMKFDLAGLMQKDLQILKSDILLILLEILQQNNMKVRSPVRYEGTNTSINEMVHAKV